MSVMQEDVNARVGARLRAWRESQGLSLDALAARSGVSRSGISAVERGVTSATAVVLDKLAAALGAPLASLFDADPGAAPSPVSRRADQPVWTDPGSGYRRRSVSPAGWPSPIRLVAVEFPAGASVAYETTERDAVVHQQVWVLAGRIEVTIGDESHRLGPGDCLAMRLDRPTGFRNPGARPARYAVVVVSEPPVARRAS